MAPVQGAAAVGETKDGFSFDESTSYIDVIDLLYEKHLPCSALVVSYNAMVLPPLQFVLLFTVLFNPYFVPRELLRAMQAYVLNLAPMRFTQPFIMMLIVGVANIPVKNNLHESTLTLSGFFTAGVAC